MKILYVAMKYDYGDESRGLSYEHSHFYQTLVSMGHDVIHFDFMEEMSLHGKSGMNHALKNLAHSEKAELLFCLLYQDQIDVDTIRDITRETDTITFNWFHDDGWRFESFSRHYAPAFSYVSTTSYSALPKYRRIGYKNVLLTQFGFNHFLYKRKPLALQYDVSFVGQVYGKRRELIASLERAGISVSTWGHGWERGRLTEQEMIDVFNQSRINLNLAAASSVPRPRWWRWPLPMRFFRPPKQIKGRVFEVPGCGGFLLTDVPPHFGDFYALNNEVGTFSDGRDLIRKVRFFLDHESARSRIAEAGYQRALSLHTYEQRFTALFEQMGVSHKRSRTQFL